MEIPPNDWSLPYDSSITTQILDVVDMALVQKTSNAPSSEQNPTANKQLTKTGRKLRVEITTDIDKTKTIVNTPGRIVLDSFFVDFVWLKIIELFSDKNADEPEPDDIDGMIAELDQFDDEPDFGFFPEADSLLEDEPELNPEIEDNPGQPCGFNISISLISNIGSYFISSYFDIGGENLDLAKLIVDGNTNKKKHIPTGLKNSPFLLKISLTSLDEPIVTNRF